MIVNKSPQNHFQYLSAMNVSSLNLKKWTEYWQTVLKKMLMVK